MAEKLDQGQNVKGGFQGNYQKVDFEAIDWTLEQNQFQLQNRESTVFSDQEIESWTASKADNPYMGYGFDCEEDLLHAFNEDDAKPEILKLFSGGGLPEVIKGKKDAEEEKKANKKRGNSSVKMDENSKKMKA